MPVPSIDNYKLQDYGLEFLRAYEAFRKSLQKPVEDPKKKKKDSKKEEPKRKPHECPKCLDDAQ